MPGWRARTVEGASHWVTNPAAFAAYCGVVPRKPKPLAPAEMYAQGVVRDVLGVRVCQHDDKSRDGMFDLFAPEIGAAIEVVRATDQEWQEAWKVGPDKCRGAVGRRSMSP